MEGTQSDTNSMQQCKFRMSLQLPIILVVNFNSTEACCIYKYYYKFTCSNI